MNSSEIYFALEDLGTRCTSPIEIVLAGGAALLLGKYVDRATNDGDVVDARPPLSRIQALIESVAEERDLSTRWLNDGVKAFAWVLPAGYRDRLQVVGEFGHLTVKIIARLDLIMMKLFAARPEDHEDLAALRPTIEEIDFVEAELPRIAETRSDKAYAIEQYLAQWRSRMRDPV